MNGLELRQRYEFSEGVVRYDIIGEGLPVVLVHGTPWSSFSWYKLAPELAKRYRVHYYDLIGFGESEKREGQDVSLPAQNRLLSELLDEWALDKPRVVAHDIGGATALRTHLLDRRDFEKMVLVNVVAMAPWGSPFFAHVRRHEHAFSDIPAYIHKAILEAYIKGALHQELRQEEFDALVQPWLGEAGQSAFYRQIAQASQEHTDEIEPDYARIRCPVLILWGAADQWIPVATGRRLHAAIPHSQFGTVAEAGHLSQLDAPERIAARVLEFLG